MNWIVWPVAFLLCVLCAVGLVIKARNDEPVDQPAPENNRYYPLWLQSCIALSDPLIAEPQKERTHAHGRAPQ